MMTEEERLIAIEQQAAAHNGLVAEHARHLQLMDPSSCSVCQLRGIVLCSDKRCPDRELHRAALKDLRGIE